VSIVDVMNVRLVSVAEEASVEEAIRTMLEAGVGSVAVTDEARLVGILTERDVLHLAGRGARMDELQVRQVMKTRLVTVSPGESVLDVARLMHDNRIRHVPVVDGEHVLGVVGVRDVLDALAERMWRTHDEAAHDTVHDLLARRRP
jgi:CBS domain-containing protein